MREDKEKRGNWKEKWKEKEVCGNTSQPLSTRGDFAGIISRYGIKLSIIYRYYSYKYSHSNTVAGVLSSRQGEERRMEEERRLEEEVIRRREEIGRREHSE